MVLFQPLVGTMRRQRLAKTANLLNKSGLLGITLRTAELLRKNKQLEKDLAQFRREAEAFAQDVMSNHENRGRGLIASSSPASKRDNRQETDQDLNLHGRIEKIEKT